MVKPSLLHRGFLPSNGPFHQQGSHRGVVGWISVTDCLLLGLVVLLAVSLSLQSKKKGTEEALEGSNAALVVAETHLEEQVDKYERDMNEAGENLQVLEDGYENLSDSFDDLSEENFALNERFENSKDEVDGLGVQLDGERMKERELKKKLSVADMKIQSLNKGNNGLSKEKFGLEQKLENVGQDLAKSENKVNELEKKLDGKYEVDEENKKLQSEIERLTMIKEKLESDKEELESDKEELESDKEELESDKEELESDKKKLANQLEMESKLHANNNRDLQAELMTRKSLYTKLQKEFDNYGKKQLEAKDDEILLRRELVGFKGDLQRVAFVIDRSGSMEKRWKDVRKTILNWVAALDIKECVLLNFSDIGPPDKYPKTGRYESTFSLSGEARQYSIDKIKKILEATKPGGQTDTYDALEAAFRFPDIDTIVLFTDGAPYVGKKAWRIGKGKRISPPPQGVNYDKNMIEETEKLCERWTEEFHKQNRQVPVNVVGVGDFYEPVFAGFLLRLAEISGGTFIGRGD